MKITTGNCRIESGRDNDGYHAFIDSVQGLSGFACGVSFWTSGNGFFVLAKRSDSPNQLFLIGLPSEKWTSDLKDEGYEIVTTLTNPKL